MSAYPTASRAACRWGWPWRRFVAAIALGLFLATASFSMAQQPGPPKPGASPPATKPEAPKPDAAAAIAEADRRAEADTADAGKAKPKGQPQEVADETPPKINYLDLMIAGGPLMIPILLVSLLVVTFGVERMMVLRRGKVLPPDLVDGLGRLASQPGGLDPRAAYRLCQKHPSAAANVIRTMLLKVGRPHTEVEHAVAEANEREAARLYSNVRWLSLAAGIAPLLGLLGTVWGMIQAFFVTANLPTGANKAQKLADGIYVALVTTFAGLAVAIPAAILAHWFEGRIQNLFRELDETLLGVLPQLERFEGRLRVHRDQLDAAPGKPVADPAVAQQTTAAPK